MISRRTLLAASGAALLAPRIGRAQGAKLKLSHHLPPAHQMHLWLGAWADNLREQSSGEIDIEIFPAGQMGPPPRQFDLVRTGVADMAFFFPALTPGRFPLSDVHLMSFAYTKPDTLKPVPAGAASAIATSLLDLYAIDFPDVKPLLSVVTPGGGFFMKDRLIGQPADLAGLRLRPTGPILASYVEAWGGSNAVFAPAEVGDAIGKGTLDGVMFSFEAARAFQLGNSVRKVSLLAASTGIFVLAIGRSVYDGLSASSRELIDATTGREAAGTVGDLYAAAEDAGRAYMEQSNVEIVEIDTDGAQQFKQAIDPLKDKAIANMEARGLPAAALDGMLRAKVADA